jgi:phosphatidylglycerophosphatase A
MNKLILLISSVFGLGYIKRAPGTFGSIAGILLWALLAPNKYNLQIYMLIAVFAISILFSSLAEKIYNVKDDQRIVIDEVAGIFFSVAFLPKTFIFLSLGFILFRVFDVKKPLFIKTVQTAGSGLGITMDDVLAGIFTNIILQIIRMIF